MPFKAVIDTNVWISALLNPSGFPAKLLKSFINNNAFHAVISEPMLAELADVLSRPRIKDKYGITDADIEELLILIEERSENVLLSEDVDICRDKDDNLIIETAIKGKAAYLVTRDDDMKFDKKVSSFLSKHDVAVISISKFLSLLKET